ncbi:MAG: ABC transporter ATP-binding protein [Firmicutes bacterium]|nr:ABC transporter ATP-binding protein [Bacillota bacterium]
MEKMIEVSHLTKSYGDLLAVDDISFYVERGKIFSFLGPNGAGKSTTIDILCTLLDFNSGECIIGGYDLRRESQEIREITGIVFQDHVLDDLLTVCENLTVRAGLYTSDGRAISKAVDEAILATELGEIANRPYGKLSGGQRRRVDIARALVQKPRILFLDEPTTGLDPQTRKSIWNTIRGLQLKSGMTLFLTTHYMEEAAGSDYVIVIDRGRIVAKGSPAALKTRYSSDTLRLFASDEELLRQTLEELQLPFRADPGEYIVKLTDTMAALPVLERCRGFISGFQVLQGTMDDAFINIVGEGLVQ